MIKKLISQLPPSSKKRLRNAYNGSRKLYYSVTDAYEFIFQKRAEFTPPRSKIFIGGGDYNVIGEEFFRHFKNLGEIKPYYRILDVGCGSGRMAVPLLKYLNKDGTYEGIDIVPEGIKWCTKKITPKHPNFHFQLADIYNKSYNPKGKNKASEYKFPYPDNNFDFIFLTSVFTHLIPEDMENYLSEISRVMKTGGRSLITFFLLNSETEIDIAAKKSNVDFKYSYGVYSVKDKEMPEDAIGFKEDFIKDLYKKYNLQIIDPIHYGLWCGRKKFLSYQDIIVATKK